MAGRTSSGVEGIGMQDASSLAAQKSGMSATGMW
jgi:hypothetical protein